MCVLAALDLVNNPHERLFTWKRQKERSQAIHEPARVVDLVYAALARDTYCLPSGLLTRRLRVICSEHSARLSRIPLTARWSGRSFVANLTWEKLASQ
jgi:hypothetical protein